MLCVCFSVCVCVHKSKINECFLHFVSTRSLSQLQKLEELDVGSNELYNLVSVEIFTTCFKMTIE